MFVAVCLGYNRYWPVLWFYVQEHPKAQPAVILVLKRFRRRGNGLKTHLNDWEKPEIEPATPDLQGICLSPTPRRQGIIVSSSDICCSTYTYFKFILFVVTVPFLLRKCI